jgi:hypothetical protein
MIGPDPKAQKQLDTAAKDAARRHLDGHKLDED